MRKEFDEFGRDGDDAGLVGGMALQATFLPRGAVVGPSRADAGVGGQTLRLHPASRAEPGGGPEAGRRELVRDVLVVVPVGELGEVDGAGEKYTKSRSSAMSTIATRTFRSAS